MGEETKKRKSSLSEVAWDVAVEELFTEEEKEALREEEEIADAKRRMIFDPEEGCLDLSKRRVTDLKGNSRVNFPKKQGNFEFEAKLETIRTEAMGIFRRYVKENCRKGGLQRSNLTKEQENGLRSLRKRVKDGEIVVLPTDKSGKFAVMSRSTYEKAGLSHIGGDEEVEHSELWEAQKQLNGHLAMLIKCFRVGQKWDQTDRVRETMLGEGVATCPVSLLFKDHKAVKP